LRQAETFFGPRIAPTGFRVEAGSIIGQAQKTQETGDLEGGKLMTWTATGEAATSPHGLRIFCYILLTRDFESHDIIILHLHMPHDSLYILHMNYASQ
jgi:hypothetical protein